MKRKRVWRYYCEYCKKSGCSSFHLAKHEKGCTLNPDRVCGMCKYVEGDQKPMTDLMAVFDDWRWALDIDGGKDAQLEERVVELERLTDGCPACMLAAARQAERARGATFTIDVEYKRRAKEMWAEHAYDGCDGCEY